MERLVLNNLQSAVWEGKLLTQVPEQKGTDVWAEREKGPSL